MPDDPNWPRASAWLSGAHDSNPECRLAVLGAPLRLGSITPGRTDLAPRAVRSVLARMSCYDLEFDRDLRGIAAADLGDLELADRTPEAACEPLTAAVRSALGDHDAVVILGGDNSITRPGCLGMANDLERCGLITLDAHLDLRDLTPALSNGNPVRALLADGLPGMNIVQIGIQAFANSRAYFEIAREAGIEVVPVGQVRAAGIERAVEKALEKLDERVDRIYFDLDLDVLDRVFAPATPGSRAGGLTPGDLRTAARLMGAHPKVRVLDLVEIDPEKDVADATAFTAGLCLLSFASGLLGRFTR
ncbi:MAG TPA: agmatinase family protein [Bryobacteraceae bacterium]|nr:agmatinase family protein [Bryobacteraceae bacterium]